ncbi:MAG: hypothetical protein JXR32_04355 [Anaerolineaceae bacterium]|nr:hypothetical protein [Anaerolineaceae bacterium]
MDLARAGHIDAGGGFVQEKDGWLVDQPGSGTARGDRCRNPRIRRRSISVR